ncbi:MAG: methyltransferase domain-containing protein [Promethearchaeota archaeon]
MRCRHCEKELTHIFIDLVNAPPSNSYLNEDQLNDPEIFYPVKLFVCDNCFLVQIDEYKKSTEIFNKKYIYFSSFSKTWLEHSKKYAEMVIKRFNLNENSYVIEVASNDGYLLQYFKEANIPCLGIEPSSQTAEVAKEKGIDVIEDYLNCSLAKKLVSQNIKADLLIGNNVLAHVPDINDFIKSLKILLDKNGILTMEFPHLMRLVEGNQFDTIYHEHYSYLSLLAVKKIFKAFGLELFDVEEISTHGGSLRIYAKHEEDKTKEISNNVKKILDLERSKKVDKVEFYQKFQEKVNNIKYNFTKFLIEQKFLGKKVIAYGAAAKGNTILNYCGIKKDLIKFVVDISPHKQGKYLPGSHIPIVNEERIKNEKPDYIIILPWNIKEEIMEQLNYVKEWNCKFVIALPELRIL